MRRALVWLLVWSIVGGVVAYVTMPMDRWRCNLLHGTHL